MAIKHLRTEVLIIGAGPSGYSAAFRCADLGLQTYLVESKDLLGGVCLNEGCIPSKTLLDISKLINQTKKMTQKGIFSQIPNLNINEVCNWKQKVVNKIAGGLAIMAKHRKVPVIQGRAEFINSHTITVQQDSSILAKITFDNVIIATGSRPIDIPLSYQKDKRIWNSTTALSVPFIPSKLLIIGGGIIGLEMATIYHSFGSQIDIIELYDQLIPGLDKDLIEFFTKIITNQFNLRLNTKVIDIKSQKDGIEVIIQGKNTSSESKLYDAVLIAIGRKPNTDLINLKAIGVEVNERGFIIVNEQMRSNVHHIYAIGDIVGQPMLAHKGMHEGHIAAEVIAGKKHYFDPHVIPYIAYTDPEIAWIGTSEKEANLKKIKYEVGIYPWSASGRAMVSDNSNGITKLISNKSNNLIIGGGIVGHNCSEILGEIALAIEMQCNIEDIALTIHAHPTLYESIGLSAQIMLGTVTDLLNKNKKHS
ncbi:MAG: dihydrolipoyl dehydrogenase [Candidatus Dasytiphilus stammeri]